MSKPIFKERERGDKTMNLFYMGEEYYFKSKTFMSPLYTQKTYQRSDWGFVEVVLQNGEEVHIRPANDIEKQWAEEEIKRIKVR